MSKWVPALLVAAVSLWAVGYGISLVPRFIAVLFWIAAATCLGAALVLHVRNQG